MNTQIATVQKVKSKDGTLIAYDRLGNGPTVILVDGALQYRDFDQGQAKLAELLSAQFTAIHYDRRGRGDSGDIQPYALEREIEDIEAIIDAEGGRASLYGISSGACLALEAAASLDKKIAKLVLYEAPYNDDAAFRQTWMDYRKRLKELLVEDRKGDALGSFMMLLGMPADQLDGVRQSHDWPKWENVAHTLAYDAAAMGIEAAIPVDKAKQVKVPTLVMEGSETEWPFMHTTAKTLAKTIPNAEHRTLEGQPHVVSSEVLAPVLIEFFTKK